MGGKGSKYEAPSGMSKRKMSFTSASMAFGAWPEKVAMCEPTINATLYFDECPSVEGLVPLCQVISSYERCAGIPEGTPGKADWRIKYVDFDPKDMIRTIEVKDDDEAHKAIEGLLHDSTRNKGLPWWEIVRIEAPKGKAKSAIVIRIDHVIGDGISLVNLMEQILTDIDGKKLDEIVPASMAKKFNRKLSFGQKFCQFFKIIYNFFVVLSLPVGKFDTKTAFRANMGKNMVYTWKRSLVRFETVPLEYLKNLKKEGGVTLNDVMFSCLGGAIRRYNLANDCAVTTTKKNITCRALMPIAFPRPNVDKNDKTAILRNKWVFVSADFGVGQGDCIERLRYINRQMNGIKNSPLAGVQLAVQESIPPKLPLNAGRQTVFDTFCRHSIIFSNVPGTEKVVKFGGKEVTGVQMYFNNLLPQVGILSYRGNVFMNMNIDTEAIPGSEMMPVYFAREMVELSEKLGIEAPLNLIERAKM
ncbi:hypothetical protein TrCOL_g7085 [Triparma columacea]|uniref:O-acyltransferase WSD1 C-terminal domain-containing protein n=1 Tax=Triparma columacea TaxID=722753 RepID=A0A9W7LCK9_9STRA|nr:hypothetical protein TrCOL_g7085 [Triparma columacea]